MNLVNLLERTVQLHGERECLRFKRDGAYVAMTYNEFWRAAMACAAGLRQCGIGQGEKVGILANNCPEWAITDYAALSIGAVVVPIYPTLPPDQVHFILTNAEVSLCIVEDPGQYAKVAAHGPATLKQIAVIKAADMPRRDSGPPWFSFSDLMELGERADPMLRMPADVDADSLATIVHTSGTSGTPKGVMLTHANLLANVLACKEVATVYASDVGLSYLPLSHIFERTVGQYLALSSGACIAYAENIESIPNDLLEVKPTILVTVPRLLEKVYSKVMDTVRNAPAPIRKLLLAGLRGSSSGIAYRLVDRLVYRKIREGLGGNIRIVVSGGAALSKEVAEFFLNAGVPVLEGYGMTESAPVISVNPPTDIRPGTVGRPVAGVQVMIAPDGELLVKGPNVMQSYYRNPEASAEALHGGWLHTGDIAELDDGYIRIVDRKKHILVLATGKNVAPAPIENAIMMSSYVAAAIVLGDGRKFVTCLLSPNLAELRPVAEKLQPPDNPEVWVQHPDGRALYSEEVRRNVAGFAPFEQPKRAVLLAEELTVESGGLTPTLKIRSKVIRERYGHLIEAMYAGTDFIPIVADPEHASGDEPSGPSAAPPVNPTDNSAGPATPSPKKPHRRRYLWGAGIVAAILLVVLLASPHLPKNLDVLGMVKGIHSTNQQISDENSQIVNHLKQIDGLAGNTPTMASHLSTLNQGVTFDKSLLTTLQGLSEQEIGLSQQFYSLAKKLHADMGSIQQSSGQQSSSLAGMNDSAAQVVDTVAQLTKVNQDMSRQLHTADTRTRTVADEMP